MTGILSFSKIPPMDIKTFRTAHNLSVIKMAELIGITRQHIYEIENKKSYPSRRLAKIIQDRTNGEVTAHELLDIV